MGVDTNTYVICPSSRVFASLFRGQGRAGQGLSYAGRVASAILTTDSPRAVASRHSEVFINLLQDRSGLGRDVAAHLGHLFGDRIGRRGGGRMGRGGGGEERTKAISKSIQLCDRHGLEGSPCPRAASKVRSQMRVRLKTHWARHGSRPRTGRIDCATMDGRRYPPGPTGFMIHRVRRFILHL